MQNNVDQSLLNFKVDRYQAATIDHKTLPKDSEAFSSNLSKTLEHFRTQGVRGIWLQLDLDQSHLVSKALEQGFKYHHAKKDYLLMQHWLPKDEPCKLPHFATHFVGVGGIVLNEEKGEILLIQERVSVVENAWKIPGGLVDDNEFISEAAEREVWEETGIKAKFQSIIAWREKLQYKWGQSDIYFAALMKPETFDIKIDPFEIKEAKWHKLDDYYHNLNMIELQKRISITLNKLRNNNIEKATKASDDFLLDVASYSPEKFEFKLGDRMSKNNVFYNPTIVNKLPFGSEKL